MNKTAQEARQITQQREELEKEVLAAYTKLTNKVRFVDPLNFFGFEQGYIAAKAAYLSGFDAPTAGDKEEPYPYTCPNCGAKQSSYEIEHGHTCKTEENKIMSTQYAPFSVEQLVGLVKYQASGVGHPYTCGKCDSDEPLGVSVIGLMCKCGYVQNWAHDHRTLAAPQNAAGDNWISVGSGKLPNAVQHVFFESPKGVIHRGWFYHSIPYSEERYKFQSEGHIWYELDKVLNWLPNPLPSPPDKL